MESLRKWVKARNPDRGLRRDQTARLLVLGFILAGVLAGVVIAVNGDAAGDVMAEGSRSGVLTAGYVLVGLSAVILIVMLLDPRGAVQDGTAGGSQGVRGTAKREFFHGKWGYYYAVIALGILGVWILCTATGGFILSPIGLVLSSMFLLGQVRANHKHDILILFLGSVVAVVSSDLIVHTSFGGDLFGPDRFAPAEAWTGAVPGGSSPAISPASWYWVIAAALGVSTWVNWETFQSAQAEVTDVTSTDGQDDSLGFAREVKVSGSLSGLSDSGGAWLVLHAAAGRQEEWRPMASLSGPKWEEVIRLGPNLFNGPQHYTLLVVSGTQEELKPLVEKRRNDPQFSSGGLTTLPSELSELCQRVVTRNR